MNTNRATGPLLCFVALLLVLSAVILGRGQEEAPAPALPPAPPAIPDSTPAPMPDSPCPGPGPCPRPRPRPRSSLLWEGFVGGCIGRDGAEIDCDLPGNLHRHNITSQGEGCCGFTSLHHAAVWQGVPALQEFPAWLRKKGLPGGAEPNNVKERISLISKERGLDEPPYVQVRGGDLDVLKAACASGRMPAVTYTWSPTGRYGGQKGVPHMVNLVAASEKWFVVLDNNYPGSNHYEWLTPEEFKTSHTGLMGGWAVILLDEGPPPVPRAKSK